MEFSTKQINRIKALRVIGIQYKVIRKRFGCSLRDIKQVLKNYPMEMTEQEAIAVLLD